MQISAKKVLVFKSFHVQSKVDLVLFKPVLV